MNKTDLFIVAVIFLSTLALAAFMTFSVVYILVKSDIVSSSAQMLQSIQTDMKE